jgi:hypothetical protein
VGSAHAERDVLDHVDGALATINVHLACLSATFSS